MIDRDSAVETVSTIVRERMGEDVTGHDWWHIDRVRTMALRIADEEGEADRFVVELAALLHDIEDHKLGGDESRYAETIRSILKPLGLEASVVSRVIEAAESVSFRGAGVTTLPRSKEGMIGQDADRLDALGAIGIARAFATGAAIIRRPIYDPDESPVVHTSFEDYKKRRGHTINHFHEKLLLLKDRLNTESAKRIAENRHQVLVDFLQEFHAEWEGER